MLNWRTYIILIISLLTFPVQQSHSCGPQEQVGSYNYTFVNPKIANIETTYAPFLLRFDALAKYTKPTEEDPQVVDNITEWHQRFCELVKKKDLEYLVYKMGLNQIKVIRSAAASKNKDLPPNLKKNTFAVHLVDHKCIETIDYLIFAKKCEPHVSKRDGWKTPKRDFATMQKLIKEGLNKFKKIDSHYIRLRYSYQLIRLAHYAEGYEQVLDLYEYLIPKLDAHASIIYDWIEGHRAGALLKLGQRVEAAYIYSKIFKNCPSKRMSAFQSFHIKTDEEWEKCMLMCVSDDERAIMYTIRASAEESRAVEEMEAIYELDPTNENLELLLVREIRKLEKDLLGLEFNPKRKVNKRKYKLPRKDAGKYAIRLEEFVHQIILDNNIPNINLWKIADGYIEFLRADFYAATRTFDRVKDEVRDPLLKEQLDVFQLALKINSYEELDNEDEIEIADMLRDNEYFRKYADFDNFLYDRLAVLYEDSDSPGKAFLAHHEINKLKTNIDIETLEDLLEIAEKEDKNRLERMILRDKEGISTIDELRDMRGTYYIAENQLEAALNVLKKIPVDKRSKYKFHPFRDELNDCVHCAVPDTVDYDKAALVQKMIDLDYAGRAALEKGGPHFFLVGLAHYNMSYYGNTWQAMDFYRSGSNWSYRNDDNIYPLFDSPSGNKENKDLSTALHYFEKARLITDNKELGARAAFMAARCEQKQWFNSKTCGYRYPNKNMPRIPEKYNTYFHMLVAHYKDTKFYKQAIKECKYFRAYAYK